MSYLFTDFMRGQIFANQALLNSAHIHIRLYAQGPVLTDDNDARYTGLKTLADLTGKLGWGTPLVKTVTLTVGTMTSSGSVYVIANNPFTLDPTWVGANVVTAVFVLEGTFGGTTDPILMITDTPFPAVVAKGDTLMALPLSVISGNRAIMSWTVPAAGAPTVIPQERPIAVLHAAPAYEGSHTQHAWLYPQRVNLVANPSFEGGATHWRTNGALTRVAGGAPTGGSWAGSFAGPAGGCVAESNQFPLTIAPAVGSAWTIQAMVKGSGTLKVGFVGWTQEFDNTYVDWGHETWPLDPGSFTHVQVLRDSAESTIGMVRFETTGTSLVLDNVLCEPDWLTNWPYFDGDSLYSAPDDYGWYGGTNLKGKTYSLWYNHRRAVVGRLFAWSIEDDDFVVTDAEVEAQGFVYGWVPAGVRVTPHLDVLWQGDIQSPPVDVAGQPVVPYKTGPNDVTGILNPWT